MSVKWIKTAHKGLRYYEHPARRHGKKKDRYYSIRFKVDNKDYDYGVGWWSDRIPEENLKNDPGMGFEEYALSQMKLFKANVKAGSGPKSPKEKRRIAEGKEMQEQADQERLEKEAVTFGHFFDDTYLPQAVADKKENSMIRERSLFTKWIKPGIGEIPLKQISSFHVEKVKKAMSDGGSAPRSIEYCLALIRQVFNQAKRNGAYKGDNPTAQVKRPRVDNARMRYLAYDEADKLLDALKEKSLDVHNQTLIALHAGLRWGEIASLTWQDVDVDRGALTIRDAKAGSRFAFMTSQLKEMFQRRPRGEPADYIFSIRGARTPSRISPTFHRVVDELGFNAGVSDPRLRVTFHSCRHTYGTYLYELTHDLYLVQKSLGHASAVMASRYAKMTEPRLKEAAAALEKAFSANGKKDVGQVVNFSR